MEVDDVLFRHIDDEESFSYPEVYPDGCEASEVWYYAKGSLVNDEFVCKLDALYNLEKSTILEEEAKCNRRGTSASNINYIHKNANKLSPKNKKYTSKCYENSSNPIKENVTKAGSSNIRTRQSSARATSAHAARRVNVADKTAVPYKMANVQFHGNNIAEIRKQLRPVTYRESAVSFRKFADNYIRNTLKPTQNQFTISIGNHIFNRVKTARPITMRSASAKPRCSWIRPCSVISQTNDLVKNCVVRPSPPKAKNDERKDLEDKDQFAIESKGRRVDNLKACRIKEERTTCNESKCKPEDEYGDTKEERALFAVTLPNVSEHYMKHMRGPTAPANISDINLDKDQSQPL